MIRAFAILPCLLLMACAAGDESAETAEAEARAVVAKEYPGVDLDGLANCVRDNASEEQMVALSLGGKVAEDATAAVLAKPETGQCVRDNNIELPS